MPVFRRDLPGRALFYAPGCRVFVEPEQAEAFMHALAAPGPSAWPDVNRLQKAALDAENAWKALARVPFDPVCLTVYPTTTCTMNCSYCFAAAEGQRSEAFSLAAVTAAAERVACNCRRRGLPFTLVVHGGGEPTLNPRRVEAVLSQVEQLARGYQLPLFRYIATNGAVSAARAGWLADRFDCVGLSCDGPQEIQLDQRPLKTGADSLPQVERTAQIVRAAGKRLHVRVTLTPQTLSRQVEIADYLCTTLHPQEIHVEPVYAGGRAGRDGGFTPDLAEEYVAQFLVARRLAAGAGVRWLTSAARPAEIHGPYCNTLRDVIQVVPGGAAVACFKTSTAGQAADRCIGRFERASSRFELDEAGIPALNSLAAAIPAACQTCFARFHCTHGCPDLCLLDTQSSGGEFLCHSVQLLLAAELETRA
jgi:sulfatase maturation enzyme AslB (radical SAM superfamily)